MLVLAAKHKKKEYNSLNLNLILELISNKKLEFYKKIKLIKMIGIMQL